MKLSNIFMIVMFAAVTFLSSCGKEDAPAPAPVAVVNFQATTAGDVDGSVAGDGGSTSNTHTWQNASATADYSMDIIGATSGKMQMIIKDASGNTVIDHTLEVGVTPDSKSGVTATGTEGSWTVTIILTNFKGTGSLSISQGT